MKGTSLSSNWRMEFYMQAIYSTESCNQFLALWTTWWCLTDHFLWTACSAGGVPPGQEMLTNNTYKISVLISKGEKVEAPVKAVINFVQKVH